MDKLPRSNKPLMRKTVAQLESMIYNRYYTLYPDGDARWGLWPMVIRAKEQKQKKKSLIKILRRYYRR